MIETSPPPEPQSSTGIAGPIPAARNNLSVAGRSASPWLASRWRSRSVWAHAYSPSTKRNGCTAPRAPSANQLACALLREQPVVELEGGLLDPTVLQLALANGPDGGASHGDRFAVGFRAENAVVGTRQYPSGRNAGA